MSNKTLSPVAPVSELKGVGKQITEKLKRLNIEVLQDLLFHLPLRYQDKTRIYSINELRVGQECLIQGRVLQADTLMRNRRMLVVRLDDTTGRLTLRFFYFSNPQKMGLIKGNTIRCFGEIRSGPQSLEIIHPDYQLLDSQATLALNQTLTPVYPTTEGLQQRTIKKLITLALRQTQSIEELIPHEILQSFNLLSLHQAIETIHRPSPDCSVKCLLTSTHPAQKRLIFEEMMAHHISLRHLRKEDKQHIGLPMENKQTYIQQLLASLPFSLTKAQQRVIAEIHHDMQQNYPMNRLVQGDVSSGKTLVAAVSALLAIENGYQVALMAPTDILAEQHYHNFVKWLDPLGLRVSWISGKMTKRARRREVENLLLNLTHIAIGTHALFQDTVQFNQLGLVIVDEQHRFGVGQRLALREKGKQGGYYPHQLIMTATPIPRTLAMTTCADLDCSIIDELPQGRQPIQTIALPNSRRNEILTRIQHICDLGQQIYWVCTLIEDSETLQCQTAEDTWKQLKILVPKLSIGLVHGRMSHTEKETTMKAFKLGEIDLLVATTVIEVGVDVPNASLMVIENAERLGLSQLHQLRGRVGRGKHASHCVLLYQAPLGKTSHRRINAMRNTNDGFEIARIDLDIRGPGEVFGTRQTGELNFRIADLNRDKHLLPDIQKAAHQLMEKYPDKANQLVKRWIVRGGDYAQV